ncbi:MAG: hypothetical protein LBF42_02845 [Puniceicoccales bacterium]|nr:hypothetical protein [Puniceicoccales bacterium]
MFRRLKDWHRHPTSGEPKEDLAANCMPHATLSGSREATADRLGTLATSLMPVNC